jgi:formylmethanofuran dehydrogenase subunit E
LFRILIALLLNLLDPELFRTVRWKLVSEESIRQRKVARLFLDRQQLADEFDVRALRIQATSIKSIFFQLTSVLCSSLGESFMHFLQEAVNGKFL